MSLPTLTSERLWLATFQRLSSDFPTMAGDFPAGRSATMAGDFPTMTDRRASGWRFGGFLICRPAGGCRWWPDRLAGAGAGGAGGAGGLVPAGGRVYKKS